MKAPVIVFAIFAILAAAGGFLIPMAREEQECVGLALLVLGLLGAVVLPFVIILARRQRPPK